MEYAPYVEAKRPQRVLRARTAKDRHEEVVVVMEPEVPPGNDEAERSLRYLVTSREVSGGLRSPLASATKLTGARGEFVPCLPCALPSSQL